MQVVVFTTVLLFKIFSNVFCSRFRVFCNRNAFCFSWIRREYLRLHLLLDFHQILHLCHVICSKLFMTSTLGWNLMKHSLLLWNQHNLLLHETYLDLNCLWCHACHIDLELFCILNRINSHIFVRISNFNDTFFEVRILTILSK